MPERVATLEAKFNSLVDRLDRQVKADAEIHKSLLVVVTALQESDKARDGRDQRLIGALAVLIAIANVVGPVIARLFVQ